MEEKIRWSDSSLRFPDGANYRIEVSGIENAEILEAVVDEAKKQEIPIHRAIATVAGSAYYSDEQLRNLARMAAKEKIEVIICPWKLARLVLDNPSRILNGLKFEDEEVGKYISEILRCFHPDNGGFRGFLVWDKDILEMLSGHRERPMLGKNAIFKLSTFANTLNWVNFGSASERGADTINTANGLSLKALARARSRTHTTFDVHITFWQNYFEKNEAGRLELMTKPYDRIEDAPKIARICSPCYFKFEAGTPGISVYDVPRPGWTFGDLAEHKRKDVRTAAQIVRTIKEKYPQLKLSDWGPADLKKPKPYRKK